MKKFLLIIITSALFIYANGTTSALFGMRNSNYGFMGIQKNCWGLVYENSLMVQKPKLQYGRVAAFYNTELPFDLSINYALYGGMRYDQEFYDYGSRISVTWEILHQYLSLTGTWQPFYDSDYGFHYGYLAGLKTFVLPEIGLFANFKNLPEYRNIERRAEGGLIFKSGNLMVAPQISTPIDGQTRLTRVSVSFLYKLPF